MLLFHKIDVLVMPTEHPPPFFLGSALRGAFGHALKHVACTQTLQKCTQCAASGQCVYFMFYEHKNFSHPYRFSKGLGESHYDFSLYLFEEACGYLPVVAKALRYMLEVQGLHVGRETFVLKSLTCNGIAIEKTLVSQSFIPDTVESCAKVIFETPLRIKSNGRLLSTKPTLEGLIASVYHRLSELKHFPTTKSLTKPRYVEGKTHIIFQDLTRFSNRQEATMQLGGITGFVEYEQLDERSYMLLKLGEIMGLGKQTVFGLGEIRVSK